MLMKMLLARLTLGAWLLIFGFLVFLLGIFLLVVRLMMLFSHVAEIVLLVGAGMLALGLVLTVLRGRRRSQDDLPYY